MVVDCGSQVILCEYPIRLDTYEAALTIALLLRKEQARHSAVKPFHCVEQVKRFVSGKRTLETNWCDWDIPLHWGVFL